MKNLMETIKTRCESHNDIIKVTGYLNQAEETKLNGRYNQRITKAKKLLNLLGDEWLPQEEYAERQAIKEQAKRELKYCIELKEYASKGFRVQGAISD